MASLCNPGTCPVGPGTAMGQKIALGPVAPPRACGDLATPHIPHSSHGSIY